MRKFEKPYPYEADIDSKNTRCEIAEGVAFDEDLGLNPKQQEAVNDLIHDTLKWIFGEPAKD